MESVTNQILRQLIDAGQEINLALFQRAMEIEEALDDLDQEIEVGEFRFTVALEQVPQLDESSE